MKNVPTHAQADLGLRDFWFSQTAADKHLTDPEALPVNRRMKSWAVLEDGHAAVYTVSRCVEPGEAVGKPPTDFGDAHFGDERYVGRGYISDCQWFYA